MKDVFFWGRVCNFGVLGITEYATHSLSNQNISSKKTRQIMNPFSTKSRALLSILAILQAFALASCGGGGSGGGGSDGAAIPALLTSLSPGSTTSPGPTLDSSAVTVSWNAASGATYYKGYIADTATYFAVAGVAINTSGTSASVTLSPGKQYRWYVDACNSSGCSMINAPYYFQTPAVAPTCTPPQVLTNGVCVTPPTTPTCTLPQVLTNGVCVTPPTPTCILPQVLTNGVCVTPQPLPAGYVSQGGLTWMPNDLDAYSMPAYTYAQATALCAGTINGQTGWRLPTQPELSALYASGATMPQGSLMDQLNWPWVHSYTWSSTPGSVSIFGNTYNIVDLGSGYVTLLTPDYSLLVTCVR